MKGQTFKKGIAGFTLVEMSISVAIALSFTVFLTSYVAQNANVTELNEIKTQRVINTLLANRLTDIATEDGEYPEPFSDDPIFSALADETDAALIAQLTGNGVEVNQVNTHGDFSDFVRVYQRVTGIQRQLQLYGESGPMITVDYSQIAVYSTRCLVSDATCNTDPLPGDSPALTSANVNSFELSGDDFSLAMDNNLSDQVAKLRVTAQRIDTLRDRFKEVRDFNFISNGDPADTSNFYPTNGGETIVNFNAADNQGCLEQWHDLSTSNVLISLSLGTEEYGVTAWGAPIEYCRKYDVDGTIGLDAPHWAALRINSSVSQQLSPVGGSNGASNMIIQL